MTTIEIIATSLGVLSSIALVISALSTTRTRLLTFAILCSIFAVAQFALVGVYVAGAVILVGIVRNALLLLSLKKEKFSWFQHWSVMLFFVLVAIAVWYFVVDWTKFELLMAVPLASSLVASVAVFFKNLIYTKILFMGGSIMWFSHDLVYGAYGLLIGEAANFVSNGIALTLLIVAARTGTKVIDPTTEVIRTITTAIPTVTSSITSVIPVITSPTGKIERGRV